MEQKKFNNIDTVITDLDDTLAPTRRTYIKYANTLIKSLSKASGISKDEVILGFNELHAKHKIFQLENVINSHRQLKRKFPNEDLKKKFAKEIKEATKIHEKEIKPSKDMLEALKTLKKRGIKLVLYTAGPSSYTVKKLNQAGLTGVFDNIYTTKDMRPEDSANAKSKYPDFEWEKITKVDAYPKSKPEVLEQIIKNANTVPSRTVVMGDSLVRDIGIAKKVGAKAVLVTGYLKEAFSDAETNMVVKIFTGGAVKEKDSLRGGAIKKESEKIAIRKVKNSKLENDKLSPDIIIEEASEITKYVKSPRNNKLLQQKIIENIKNARR